MDKTKFSTIIIVNNLKRARQLRNSPHFISCIELGNGFYELEMKKTWILLDLPIHLGWVVLMLAKLLMLEFSYDFLDVFVDRNDYRFVLTDTDSIYISMSGPTLESIIKPEYKDEYHAIVHLRHEEQNPLWVPRMCCDFHIRYDRRHPGIMKLEASGYHIIALSSKTYLLKQDNDKFKVSCKGIMKNRLEDPASIFEKVLTEQTICEALNVGIKLRESKLCTYKQTRLGFGYIYWKRVVLDDGISTKPLSIVLSPWEKLSDRYFFAQFNHPLHMNFTCNLVYEDNDFFSLSQLILFKRAEILKLSKIQEEILKTKNCSQLKPFYSRIKYSEKWEEVKREILAEFCLFKMRCIREVRRKLYESSNMEIIFCSGFDKYLSVGVHSTVAELLSPGEYRGRNVLGEIWSEIRDKYSEEIGTYGVLAKRCIICQRRRSDVNAKDLCTSCSDYRW